MHFYSLIYAKVCWNDDRNRCEKIKERAALFAKEYIYWFDNKGRALPYGRSLTYRFAQVAFWSACLFADVDIFNYGVIKGIIVRHLEEWMSNPIFDNDGILTLGYRYPNVQMTECYSSPGSPYWALKAFLMLALEDKHPFWNADIEEMPDLDKIKLLEQAEMIIQYNKNNVVALVTGRRRYNVHTHISEKYCKFAYSSEFGFSVPRSNKCIEQASPDSMLSFEIDGYIFTRRLCDEISVDENEVKSSWSPFTGITVETVLIPTERGHIRKHVIKSDIDCYVRDAGFAVSQEGNCRCLVFKDELTARVENDFSYCEVKSLTDSGEAETLITHPSSSVVYQRTYIPAIKYKVKCGITYIETEIRYF